MPSLQPKTGIDPQALLAIRDMELRARVVVEGLWAGLHRSPLEGFSVEFTEYRQYSPGDDLRYLDWKALARTDREYIKKFEDETNLRCLIVLDTSRSMSFGSRDYSKSDYARTLAATFGYFLLQQRDVVGLALFDSKIRDYLPARWRPGHFKRLLAMLDRKAEGRETKPAEALKQTALLSPKRSLILVVSDFLSPPEEWKREMGQLIVAGHDVRALQILDPAERNLEFGQAAEWEDLENGNRIYIDPELARQNYLSKFNAHQENLKKTLEELGIRHQIVRTDLPLDFALLEMMRQRGIATRAQIARRKAG